MCHLSQDSGTFCAKLRGVKPLLALVSLVALPSLLWSAEIIEGEMAGYLFAPAEKVPEEFNGGFSLYAAAWPLVGTYPGHRFQTGLCGTWMHPQWSDADQPKEKCYTDIEGGIGGEVAATDRRAKSRGIGDAFIEVVLEPATATGSKRLSNLDITAAPAFIHIKAFDLPPQPEKLVLDTAGVLKLGEVMAQSYRGGR